jgi:hypothetical protein
MKKRVSSITKKHRLVEYFDTNQNNVKGELYEEIFDCTSYMGVGDVFIWNYVSSLFFR